MNNVHRKHLRHSAGSRHGLRHRGSFGFRLRCGNPVGQRRRNLVGRRCGISVGFIGFRHFDRRIRLLLVHVGRALRHGLFLEAFHLLDAGSLVENHRLEIDKGLVHLIAQRDVGRKGNLRMSGDEDAFAGIHVHALTLRHLEKLKGTQSLHFYHLFLHHLLGNKVEESTDESIGLSGMYADTLSKTEGQILYRDLCFHV